MLKVLHWKLQTFYQVVQNNDHVYRLIMVGILNSEVREGGSGSFNNVKTWGVVTGEFAK